MGTACCSSRNAVGLEEDEETRFSSEFYEYTFQGPQLQSYSLFNRCASELSLCEVDTPPPPPDPSPRCPGRGAA